MESTDSGTHMGKLKKKKKTKTKKQNKNLQ